MFIPRVVCENCHVVMEIDKNDVIVEMLTQDGQPYYKIASDRYRCRKCGRTVLCGFARQAISEHWHQDYSVIGADVKIFCVS